MSMVAGKAVINIYPSMKGFKTAVNKELSSIGTGATKTLSSGLNSIASSIGNKLASAVKGIAVGAAVAGIAAIGSSIGDAIDRIDSMNRLPKVLQNIGMSAKDAAATMENMMEYVQGLPLATQDVVSSLQRIYGRAGGDAQKAQAWTKALYDTILAGGTSTELATAAIEQFVQAVSKGKFDMREWRSVVTAAPAQMTQVAKSMLGAKASTDDLYESLKSGETSMEAFMDAIVKLDTEGGKGITAFSKQARDGVSGIRTDITNARMQLSFLVADIMTGLGVDPNKNPLSTTMKNLRKYLQGSPAFQHLLKSVKDFFNDPKVQQYMQTVLQVLGFIAEVSFEALATAIEGATEFMGDMNDIIQDIKKNLEDMGFDAASLDAISMGQVIGNVITGVMTVLTLPIRIIMLVTRAVTGAMNTIREKVDAFLHSPAGIALRIFFAEVKTKVDDFKTSAERTFENLAKKAQPIVDAFEPIKQLFDDIKETIEAIVQPITNAANTVKEKFSWAFTDVRTQSENTNTNVSRVFGQMKNNIGSSMGSASTDAQNKLRQIPNGASGAKSTIASFFTGTATAIKNQIGSTSNIGSDIVSGIVSGINYSKGTIGYTLVNGISSAIAKAKAAIKSNSPSKLTRDVIGKPIMQGVAVGIETETGLVGSTFADSLTDALAYGQPVTYTGALGVGMGATAGVNVVNQNITLYETNPVAVAQVLENRYAAALA